MRLTFELHGTLAGAVERGRERLTLVRDLSAETVGDALLDLTDRTPPLRPLVLDSKGTLRAHVAVRRNGEDVRDGEGMATTVADGDRLELEPGVKGGC